MPYDPNQVSYEELLEVFWSIHDPTQFNRQGPDRGEQYRSVIFHHDPEQEVTARKSKHQLDISGKYEQPIVTKIQPASEYYLADESHQNYHRKQNKTNLSGIQ